MATFTSYRKKDGSISYTAQIRIRREGEIVYSESFTRGKKSLVTAWAKRREAELEKPGALEQVLHRGVAVRDVLTWYEGFSERAGGRSKLAQVKFLQGASIADRDAISLTVEQVLEFAEERRRGGASPATINQDIIWLRLALKNYRLAKNVPVASHIIDDAATLLRQARIIGPPQQRSRRPSLPELESLLDYFSDRRGGATIPMDDIVLMALFSARREDEICRIRWEDLDDRRKAVLVPRMKHPRGVRDTTVFLTDEAWEIIRRQPRDDGRIFPYNSKSVSAAFTRACKYLGIEGLRFHDMRHECTSWLFERCWDIPQVANVTGHMSWASLQRYTHLRERGPFDKYESWKWRPVMNNSQEGSR